MKKTATVSWNATSIDAGIQNHIKDDTFYSFIRIFDDQQNSFRIAYAVESNKLIIMRTVGGTDETLKTL